jgi:hypothetical protein
MVCQACHQPICGHSDTLYSGVIRITRSAAEHPGFPFPGRAGLTNPAAMTGGGRAQRSAPAIFSGEA